VSNGEERGMCGLRILAGHFLGNNDGDDITVTLYCMYHVQGC
jgi:hypothetical protein